MMKKFALSGYMTKKNKKSQADSNKSLAVTSDYTMPLCMFCATP